MTPETFTAGPSRMASTAPSEPAKAPKITHGPAPKTGHSGRFFVDPASVPRFKYGQAAGRQ